MEMDTALNRTRLLLNFSQKRKKLIEDFIASSKDHWELMEERKYNMLEFSRFLTFKGVINWDEVTSSVVQSFIINQENEAENFNSSSWINSMKDFFSFLMTKNITQDNPFLRDDILPKEEAEERLTPVRTCLRCGVSLDNKIAKHCKECSTIIKKEATLRWNKEHREQLREANRKWRERNPERAKQLRLRYRLQNIEKIKEQNKLWKQKHPDKIKAYREKYIRQKAKRIRKQASNVTYGRISAKKSSFLMSDWCKELRNSSTHLLWMRRQKKRLERIRELENKFNSCWEDKFKEVFERYNRGEAARILSLNYRTLFVWAKHLKLKRSCIYCRKKLIIAEGTFHPECKVRYEPSQQSQGIKELFSLIDPTVNVSALNLNSDEIGQVIKDSVPNFSNQELLVIENRYLFFNKKQTLEEIGAALGVTRERVRQIEQKAIKKLSHPVRQKIIKDKLSKLIFKDTSITDSSLNRKVNELQSELNRLKQKLTNGTPGEISNVFLTEFELSVRAYNCLKEASIKTVGQLANRTESEMLSICNLGKKTLWELKQILYSFGLRFHEETILSDYQREKKKAALPKKKCLFVNCNVTIHKGKYCSKHKTSWRRKRALELLENKKEIQTADKKHAKKYTIQELKEIHTRLHPRASIKKLSRLVTLSR